MVSKKIVLLFVLVAWLCVFSFLRTAYAPELGACHVETRDEYYAKQSTFYPGEPVYVNGSGFQFDKLVDIHVVGDTAWSWGMLIPSEGIVISVQTSGSGEIPMTMVWSSAEFGRYDIVVDVDRNGKYDNCDCLLDNVVVSAGFLVIPEYVIGTALGVAGFFGAFGTYRLLKRRSSENVPR